MEIRLIALACAVLSAPSLAMLPLCNRTLQSYRPDPPVFRGLNLATPTVIGQSSRKANQIWRVEPGLCPTRCVRTGADLTCCASIIPSRPARETVIPHRAGATFVAVNTRSWLSQRNTRGGAVMRCQFDTRCR